MKNVAQFFSWRCGRILVESQPGLELRGNRVKLRSEMQLGMARGVGACEKTAETAREFGRSWPGFEGLLQLGFVGLESYSFSG